MSLLMMLKSIKKANPSSVGMRYSTANSFEEELVTLFSDIGQTPICCKIRVLL